MKVKLKEASSYVMSLVPQTEYESRVKYWEEQIQKGNHRPILVDENDIYRIIDGNHTLQAYKNLGREDEIQVYKTNRINFLNGAAAIGELAYIQQGIEDGTVVRVK